jgi:hypothetical protein
MFLSSCGEDEETPPEPATILLNPDIDIFEGEPGDVVETQISVNAPAGLISVTINKTVGTGSPSEYDKQTPDAGENQLIFDFSYTLVTEEIGEVVKFDIIVEDAGSATSATTSFTVETSSPPARSYTAVLLYAPLGDKTAASFFSTTTGLTYSPEDVTTTSTAISPEIDFGYYYGVNDEASLASPLGYSSTVFADQVAGWNTLNDITFLSTTLGSSEFNELGTFADIDAVFDAGTDEGNVITGLSVGQVLAFQTDADKAGGSIKGVLLVSDIQGTFNENDYIELEIIVQEPAE